MTIMKPKYYTNLHSKAMNPILTSSSSYPPAWQPASVLRDSSFENHRLLPVLPVWLHNLV